MKNCAPENWEVCILFDSASEEDRQHARLISTREAVEIIKKTTDRGEIHQLFYFEKATSHMNYVTAVLAAVFHYGKPGIRGIISNAYSILALWQ